ncbi:MAG TPA: MogA/MoaB family molybdenum cofactor biosynthesis protein [Terracidiphilus sp.]|nr:MogA/MoaB family molybdenum cofactor biosynthesis protein [Terracidiphilus sp.]
MLLCVLTVSDRCSQGLMTDTAGPAVAELLRQYWPAARIATALVPDKEDEIIARLLEWASMKASLILTAGGTGLSPRDRTPEATARVLDRLVPGLSEAMRARGAEKNQFAWLSRSIAGLRGTTVIVNLPGSKRGAEESLSSILPLLNHAIEVAGGGQAHL